jgi:hypothetical protein
MDFPKYRIMAVEVQEWRRSDWILLASTPGGKVVYDASPARVSSPKVCRGAAASWFSQGGCSQLDAFNHDCCCDESSCVRREQGDLLVILKHVFKCVCDPGDLGGECAAWAHVVWDYRGCSWDGTA